MVVLATAATVIASQAMISGAFSMARQCVQLGFLPRMTVRHTSTMEEGQIYLPQVNSMMVVGVTDTGPGLQDLRQPGRGLWHRRHRHLPVHQHAGDGRVPPGISLVADHLCRGVRLVLRDRFPVLRLQPAEGPEGGWVPLVLGVALTALMTSWKRGRDLLLARWRQDSLPLAPFLARLPQSRTVRVPGMAVFLTGNPDYVPTSLLHNLKHNKVLHERVLFVTVQNVDEPEVASERRTEVAELAPGIHRVILRYGFMESPNIPRALEELSARASRSTRCRRATSSAARCWCRRRCQSCPGGGIGCSWCWRATRCRPPNSSASRTTGWWSSGCASRSEVPAVGIVIIATTPRVSNDFVMWRHNPR